MRTAVPEGESTFPAWCASTISTESKCRAAIAANAEPSTLPTEKFGTKITPRGDSSRRSLDSTSAMRSRDHPDVPTTTAAPAAIAASTIAGLADGCVTSKTTSAPASSSRLDDESSPACRSRSSASSMSRVAKRPIFPVAPATATVIVTGFTLPARRLASCSASATPP
ncbi:hypothetical protein GCM10025870_05230 [Agromyces marinus]|uniref:Uncharacterized protein n=1 Tax=Agromyces marinus TaxID=1389020 RepID=A0ABM8GYB8_9MICO|nr:hypothetical protein GCM10025870_05230 [Agromyces marinus]